MYLFSRMTFVYRPYHRIRSTPRSYTADEGIRCDVSPLPEDVTARRDAAGQDQHECRLFVLWTQIHSHLPPHIASNPYSSVLCVHTAQPERLRREAAADSPRKVACEMKASAAKLSPCRGRCHARGRDAAGQDNHECQAICVGWNTNTLAASRPHFAIERPYRATLVLVRQSRLFLAARASNTGAHSVARCSAADRCRGCDDAYDCVCTVFVEPGAGPPPVPPTRRG
uniref:Uncharacterized protein n=1 Tax=Heliothis virescens TaxID=7102 RepID=A0A2A4JK22_HELVI